MNKLKKLYALSNKGAKDMMKGIVAVVASNIALMIPVGLLYFFTGECLNGSLDTSRYTFYIIGIVVCLAFIAMTTFFQYNATFFTTYVESGTRRINLAEKLRKLPLSFFAKRDLADLTNAIMTDVEALEHAGSHQIPQYYGSIVSTVLISIGLFFFEPTMALAAVWPIPIAILIVLTSKKVQNVFTRKQAEVKLALNEGVQEFIETSRDLKSNNAESKYLSGLNDQIDLLEKRSIFSELGSAVFVISSQMILKFGIVTVALVGGSMLMSGSIDLMQFFCFLLVALKHFKHITTINFC